MERPESGEIDAPTVGPRTSHQFVRDRLRRSIVTGELAGGMRLIQGEIANELGVSTTPVREALRDLAAQGLIRFDPHRGAVVHAVEVDEFDEIYEMRLVLEPLAVRRSLARITQEEIDEASRIQRVSEQTTDPGRWIELNRHFHSVFTIAARSPRLGATLKQLRDISSLYIGHAMRSEPAMMRRGNAEHRQLIEAFRDKDVDRAVAVSIAHLQTTRRAGEETLPKHA